MTFKDIMAISGHAGLFRFVAQGRSGIIVESLTDNKRMQVPATAKVSTLRDISIYTSTGEEPLSKVLERIRVLENDANAIDHKSDNEEIKAYFLKVLPEFDEDRVYLSDMKKIISWYNQLQKIGMLDFSDEEEETENNNEEVAETEE